MTLLLFEGAGTELGTPGGALLAAEGYRREPDRRDELEIILLAFTETNPYL